jgi:hypothetical protein
VVRQLTDGFCWDAVPAFSSDGKPSTSRVAIGIVLDSMGGWTWDHFDVYTIDTDGQNLQRLTQEEYYSMTSPAFWDKDDWILFTSGRTGGCRTRISFIPCQLPGDSRFLLPDSPHLSAEGGAPSFLNFTKQQAANVWLCSDRARPYSYDICCSGESGWRNDQVVGALAAGTYNKRPRLTADGSKIFFLAENVQESTNSLWQVGSDGKDLHRSQT